MADYESSIIRAMKTKPSILFTLSIAAAFAVSVSASQQPVHLGAAGDFAVLAKAGISTTGTTSIVGDIGVSPIDSTALTGFTLSLDATETFATSPFVTGVAYASDYAVPTPTYMKTVIGDMEIAYADAEGRTDAQAVTELGAGDISGLTLEPNLYKWGTGLRIDTDVTLAGSSCDVWIFQIAQDLTVGDGVRVILSGGARASNIFWQVEGEAVIGTTAHVEGTILSSTAIHLRTGASINGALLAQTAVTLDASSVTIPSAAEAAEMLWLGFYDDRHLDPTNGEGWLDHSEHGWLYTIPAYNGTWFYDQIQHNWLWTNACTYPYLYNASTENWVAYHPAGNPNERWFYVYDEQEPTSSEWQLISK